MRRLVGIQPDDKNFTFFSAVQEFEEKLIEWALEEAQGSIVRAARLLGLKHQTLSSMLNQRHKKFLEKRTPRVKRLRSIIKEPSARVIRHTHSVLHNALKQAVKWSLSARNPSDLVELPKVPHKERRVLSPDEAVRFLAAAHTASHGLVFEFALLTGMRPEEYLALKWTDIDFERSTSTVRRALVRHKGSWSFQETKTSRSRRTIFLPSQLLYRLAAHKRQQAAQRLQFGSSWQNFDLVFCSETGSPLSIPNLTYRYFRPILEKAELPILRLYDLRHSCATLLLIAEENPKVVSERLGHSTIVLTLDTYSHVLPTMQQNATAKLEKLLYENTAPTANVREN